MEESATVLNCRERLRGPIQQVVLDTDTEGKTWKPGDLN